MKKRILNSILCSMILLLGFSLAIAETTVDFKFQSNPTDEQIFKATVTVLKHYKFNIWDEDAEALSIKAMRKITKDAVYYLEYSIEIKEKQISVLAKVIEYGAGSGTSGGTVFGKTVSRDTRFSPNWRFEKELHDARWLIGKVLRIVGTRLDAYEFKSQLRN
jgi:hypothetical protein